MSKRKISKKKIIVFIAILLIIISAVVGGILFINNNKIEKGTIKVEDVDTIEGYDYKLRNNATSYYKKLFKELKEVLEASSIDEEKYAELISKLFVADFFNLENKLSKTDIGGTQFVYQNFRKDFEKLASTSMYKSVENNIYGDRKQDLPVVVKVSLEKGINDKFVYGDKVDEKAYIIKFDIEYETDLGYQKAGTIVLIHNDKKLEIASLEESNLN